MSGLVPTPWQGDVLSTPEDVNLLLAGGRGVGRTTGALMLALRHCEKYGERAHVLMVRQHLRSLSEVEDSLTLHLTAAYPKGLRVNRAEHTFRLPSGATIECSPLADVTDYSKLQGRSLSLIVVDEYGTFSSVMMGLVDLCRSNLRAGDVPTRLVLLANPGGRGHAAITKRFISKAAPWVPTVLEDGSTWIICPGSHRENPHLPASYTHDLFAACGRDTALFKAWSEGSWAIGRGAALADVIDESKQMISARNLGFDIHNDNTRTFLSADWGTAAPSVCYLAAKLRAPVHIYPRGSLVLIDEVHSADLADLSIGLGWSLGRLADEIHAMCDRWKIPKRSRHGVIDNARGLNPQETLIGTMQRYGLQFMPPQKGRREALSAMREMLFNSAQGNQRPGMYITDACTGFWETVPVLPRDPRNPEATATDGIDHWYDAASYAVMHLNMIISSSGKLVGGY